MDPRRLVGVGICLGLLAGFAAEAATPEDAAQAAAESWLRLVDAGDYAASWDQAGKILKTATKQSEWVHDAGAVRAPLGKLVSRKVTSREYTERAPNTRVVGGKIYTWGKGKYVILHFDTAFASKRSATEIVTVAGESDGAWRVSGYSIP